MHWEMTSGTVVNTAAPTGTQGLDLAEFNAELSERLVGPDSLIRPEEQQSQLIGRCQPRIPNETLAQAFALLSAPYNQVSPGPGDSSLRTVKPEA